MPSDLLRVIHRLGQRHTFGLASKEQCQSELGVDDASFVRALGELSACGFLRQHGVPAEAVKLSFAGLIAAEQFSDRLPSSGPS